MPDSFPSRLKAIQHPGCRERQGRTIGLIHPPTSHLKTMDKDSLRALQRHNELSQFLDYERRLRAAYARSQDSHPRRRLREDSSR